MKRLALAVVAVLAVGCGPAPVTEYVRCEADKGGLIAGHFAYESVTYPDTSAIVTCSYGELSRVMFHPAASVEALMGTCTAGWPPSYLFQFQRTLDAPPTISAMSPPTMAGRITSFTPAECVMSLSSL